MALVCAAIRRDLFSFLKFSFINYVQVCCFSSYFCFQVVIVLLIFVFSVLFLVVEISFFPLFHVIFESRIDVSTQSLMLVSPHPASLLICIVYLCPLCKALCIVICFLVPWSICWSSPHLHFKIGPEYLTRWGEPRFLSLWWNSCSQV